MRFSEIVVIFLLCASTPAFANYFPFDEGIEDHIESEITLDENITADIDVTSHDGIVYLEGNVSSREEANRIIDIADSTAGVFLVDVSNLNVVQ